MVSPKVQGVTRARQVPLTGWVPRQLGLDRFLYCNQPFGSQVGEGLSARSTRHSSQ